MTFYQDRLPRSFPCNGPLVRSLREKKGLRQVDLAQLAGYSVRLIGKAEASKHLSKATIEVLAEALSSIGKRIEPHQLILSLTNLGLEYQRARYSAEPDAVSKVANLLDNDFKLHVFGGNSTFDFKREYHGHAGLVEYFQRFFSVFKPVHYDDPAESGDQLIEAQDELLIWSDNVWHPKPGNMFPVSVTSRLEFRDGLLTLHEERIAHANHESCEASPSA